VAAYHEELAKPAAEVSVESKRVCPINSPWNSPINLSFGPLFWAIAVGNT